MFRSFSGFDGGVSIAILLMNLVVPLLDKIVPKPFGYKKPNKEEACA
ncbi:MAG: RnfABCDGE type electron transport complex subunit D [Clostridia bacterium]|nr:RnfABCDGE type electron transport complex subunit D [Clostridia bacterium]